MREGWLLKVLTGLRWGGRRNLEHRFFHFLHVSSRHHVSWSGATHFPNPLLSFAGTVMQDIDVLYLAADSAWRGLVRSSNSCRSPPAAASVLSQRWTGGLKRI